MAAASCVTRSRSVLFDDGRLSEMTGRSFEVVVSHFGLGDVPEELRSKTVGELARLLVPGGRLYVREPLDRPRGLTVEGLRSRAERSGLREEEMRRARIPGVGHVCTALFRKPRSE